MASADIEIFRLGSNTDIPIVSLLVPFSLETAPPADVPSYLSGSTKVRTSLATTFTKSTPDSAPALIWGLQHSRVVDIDVRSDLTESDALFESFEELLTVATKVPEGQKANPIILCKFAALRAYHNPYTDLISNSQHSTTPTQPDTSNRETDESPDIPRIPISHCCTFPIPQPVRQVPAPHMGCSHTGYAATQRFFRQYGK